MLAIVAESTPKEARTAIIEDICVDERPACPEFACGELVESVEVIGIED